MLSGLSLGIALALAGLVLIGLVWGWLRLLPTLQPGQRLALPLPPGADLPEPKHGDAMLLIEPGGRVGFVNGPARRWFDLEASEIPNLERLARRVRPAETFLALCAEERRARISINGRMAEVSSYRVPGPDTLMMVVIHSPEFGVSETGEVGLSGEVLRTVTEFGQAIAASLDLEATLAAVLDNVSRLVPAEVLEVKVWDEAERRLVPYWFTGSSAGAHHLERAGRSQFGVYSDLLVERREPLFVPDTHAFQDAPVGAETRLAVRSYIGVPLQAGGQLVGTLEAGLAAAQAFSPDDLALLRLIAGQAAVAIRNAVLYRSQQRRAEELTGLANLAQAVGASADPRDFFGRLVGSVASLFDVEILGFLLYVEDRRVLEGQVPFQGLPAHVVDIYRAAVHPGSPGEQWILNPQSLTTLNAMEDPRWAELGLQDVSQAASIRDTALIPLVSGGRFLGFFQLSNHRGGPAAFGHDELRLANIIANQAAALIDNVSLLQQSRQRAQRAEALRRIASLAGSNATTDELLRFALHELARLVQADVGGIFLLNDRQGLLQVHLPSLWGIAPEQAGPIGRLSLDDPQYRHTVSGSRRSFLSGRLLQDTRVLPIYRPLVEALGMQSAIVVPLVTRERSVGELMVGARRTDAFTGLDLQLLSTAAGQLAAAIEQGGILAQTDESLRRRVEQLTALTRVNRALSVTLDLEKLLRVIHEESLRITAADCGTITLLEGEGDPALRLISHQVGCPADGLSDLEREALRDGQPRLAAHFDELQPAPHEGVRSALVVPIAYQERAAGVIHVHARRADAFDQLSLEGVQALAAQAAIALGNARRFHDLQLRGEALRRRAEALHRLSTIAQAISAESPLEGSLQAIATGLQQATPFQTVVISVAEPETGLLRRVAVVGLPPDLQRELMGRKQPYASVAQLMRPEFKLGAGYYIPADRTPIIPADVHYVTIATEAPPSGADAWNPDDFLLFPLLDSDDKPLGLISLDAPVDGRRPDLTTAEAAEVFAAQAALVISGHARLEALRAQVEALNAGLQRQQRLLSVSQDDLPMLLRKDLEQTIAIHNLERRAQRIRAGLQIAESVGRQLDASSALLALGREILTRLGMSVALVADETPEGPRLLHVMGNVPRATNPEALFGQRNPLRTCLQTGEAILVMNLEEDDEWREAALLTSLRAKAFICLPVNVEQRTVAAILAISPEPLPALTDEDRQVYFQIVRQTSVILQNISLLGETRRRLGEVNLLLDFSRRLSGLEPTAILHALLDSSLRVLPAAHAGAVLLWEPLSAQLVPVHVERYADAASLMKIRYRAGEALPGQVFAERRARRVDEINFTRDYALSADNLLHYRQGTGGRLPVSSLLIPIQTAESALGVLVLDNFNTVAAFRPEDENLLLSLAQQVALALENVRLVQAAQQRAGQLQALTGVSAELAASLRREELVPALLNQLRRVLPFDTGILWLRDGAQLRVAAARGFPDSEQRLGLTVAVEDSALFKEMLRTRQAIRVGDVRHDPRFPGVGPVERLSWLGVPLVSKNELIGAVALEKTEPNFYSDELIQLATTFAGQAAVALENARLYEESVARAAELDQRSRRLALLNRFSSDLSGQLDAGRVLQLTAQELMNALSADRLAVVTLEQGRPVATLTLPAGGMPQPLPLTSLPLIERLRESLGVFVTEDVRREPDLSAWLPALWPETRSLMILPLSSGSGLYALLFLQSQEVGRFRLTEIELARTIGNQASIALESARLYQSTLSTAGRLSILSQTSYQISSGLDPEQIYSAVHEAVKRLMPLESFVIALLDKERQEIEGVYLMDGDVRSPNMRLPLGQGLSGYVVATGEPILIHGSRQADDLGGITYGERGTPASILAVPMKLGNEVLGMLSAQSYLPNVYTEEDQQILSTLASQAIVAIQNARLFAETQRLAQELEQRVIERTAQLDRERQNTETLLRILTEVSASLDLDRALNRTLALLNDAIGAEQGTIMLIHPEDNLLHYRAGYGYLSAQSGQATRAFTLKIGEGLAGWVVKNREAVLVEDLHRDPRWVHTPQASQNNRSAVVAPLMVGEDVIGALLVFHRTPRFFSPEQLNLVKAIASQVAVAINNARLYELIRDQAERLGSMLRREQEDASRSQAILEAVADGVLVTGPDNKITFLNQSAERILGLQADRVIGRPLETFVGLFGRAASAWTQTIRSWSENPSSHQPGESYAEQIELENGRIVLVHLSPVILQNDFLGTVSIFRDITREVEVDRLKSEFVATVSHELRTPMTSIRGYTDILLMGAAGALNENQAHFLQIIKNNTERLNILVNDLLDISRIEAGRVVLSPQPLDLREVAEDVAAELLRRSQQDHKPMAIQIEAPPDLPRVLGDLERVRQILGNLVDNAYNYTPANGRITVRLQAVDGNAVQVDVQDTGVGIAPAEQERIFERFYRGEHPLVLATPGTGLGLSIVKQLVEMHNGRIWMTSRGVPGEGSTFSFTLPLYQGSM